MDKHTLSQQLLLFLCILGTRLLTSKASDPLNENGAFPCKEQLDDNYSLKWKFNSSHIMFHVTVKTRGWVGFGLSAHGDMYPGDMVIAWMSGETVHFQDRHATGRVMPVVDTQQDWDLVRFQREDNLYNTFTVIRKLVTCDEEGDLPILEGTTRVIYAYSDAVPDSDDNIPYHGPSKRGSKSLLLLDPPPIDDAVSKLPKDAIAVDILNKNYSVPGKDTTYSCIVMKFPRHLKEKHHLIRYEPVIQTGHEKLVHHIILYYCVKPVPESLMNKPYECYENESPEINTLCEYAMVAWGIGGTAFDYPAHVGHSFGTADDPVYFKIETHYDNAGMRSDFVDNSGLRLYLTKELRTYDAGMLLVGAFTDPYHIIPPHMDNFLTRGQCPPQCLEEAFGDGEIRIVADVLHSHLIGDKMATRHIRDGVELPPILKDDFYDFNYQESRILPEERVVKKSDTLVTDCFYDSSGRTGITYGGLSSREEMCLSFLLYYPKTKLNHCSTRVTYTKDSKPMYAEGVFNYINKTDWTIKSNRDAFAKNVQESDVTDICVFSNTTRLLSSPQPLKFTEFVPENMCKFNGAERISGNPSKLVIIYLSSFIAFLIIHSRL